MHHLRMMTEQLGFSILTAPLAAVDRRALSQAWYSALHLAHGARPAGAPDAHIPAAAPHTAHTPQFASRTSQRGRATVSARVPLHERKMAVAAPRQLERRNVRSALARKIERTFLDPRTQVQHATFTVGEDAARVHVSLQTTGDRVRLVAVCAPSVRPAVARALAQARFALAARGIEVAEC